MEARGQNHRVSCAFVELRLHAWQGPLAVQDTVGPCGELVACFLGAWLCEIESLGLAWGSNQWRASPRDVKSHFYAASRLLVSQGTYASEVVTVDYSAT